MTVRSSPKVNIRIYEKCFLPEAIHSQNGYKENLRKDVCICQGNGRVGKRGIEGRVEEEWHHSLPGQSTCRVQRARLAFPELGPAVPPAPRGVTERESARVLPRRLVQWAQCLETYLRQTMASVTWLQKPINTGKVYYSGAGKPFLTLEQLYNHQSTNYSRLNSHVSVSAFGSEIVSIAFIVPFNHMCTFGSMTCLSPEFVSDMPSFSGNFSGMSFKHFLKRTPETANDLGDNLKNPRFKG
eukprot:bmy_20117T0